MRSTTSPPPLRVLVAEGHPIVALGLADILQTLEYVLVGSGAARLAAIPAGESPANRGVQCCCSHIQRREGWPTRRKPGCKSPRWARETWSDPSRGASNLTGRSKREPVKPRKASPA